jgi:hypothetical protein
MGERFVAARRALVLRMKGDATKGRESAGNRFSKGEKNQREAKKGKVKDLDVNAVQKALECEPFDPDFRSSFGDLIKGGLHTIKKPSIYEQER